MITGTQTNTVIAPDSIHNAQPENRNSGNVFLTGDNLEVLKHLQNAYRNSIDMIYIDPPYNTGKEFVYSDSFELTDEQLKNQLGLSDTEVERLKSIQGKSSHSAWLTFMYPRLKIAQRLLKETGVIFISIDDNEQANLKLLCDEVFGEIQYVGDIIRKTKSTTNDNSTGFNIQHENTLVYAKEINKLDIRGEEKTFSNYTNLDNDPRGAWVAADPSARTGSYFEIVNPHTGTKDLPPLNRQWLFSEKSFAAHVESGKIKFKEEVRDGERGFIFKRYKNEVKSDFSQINSLFGADNMYMNQAATKERNKHFGDLGFDYPKPSQFMKKLIQYGTSKDSFVLDFFAGSATTADAVLQMNAEDDGNRKYMMVQINQKIRQEETAFRLGYQTIDEISRERIKRASKKIQEETENLPETFDGGFKHYRVFEPAITTIEKLEEFDPNHDELIPENMIEPFATSENLGDAKGEEVILQTWLINDGYKFDTIVETKIFESYEAHYVNESKLYLINDGWGSEQTKELLNQIGNYKLNVKNIILYGYSFTMESLQELEINVKNNLDQSITIEKRY